MDAMFEASRAIRGLDGRTHARPATLSTWNEAFLDMKPATTSCTARPCGDALGALVRRMKQRAGADRLYRAVA